MRSIKEVCESAETSTKQAPKTQASLNAGGLLHTFSLI